MSQPEGTIRSFLDPAELFRRYFVNTLFDSTFVVLGILAATTAEPTPDIEFAMSAIVAASLAIGISTGVSVYEAEHTEGEIRLRRLERAMLSPMRHTQIARRLRSARIAVAGVNFLAPIFVALVTTAPILMHQARILPDFLVASALSGALALGIILVAGYYLGKLTGRKPWRKAIRMSSLALLTFGALLAIEHLL
jgi:predicted membrane protein (TIGR00267 family)